MGDDAVVAMIEAGRRDDDHFPLGFRQPAVLLEQRVMVGERTHLELLRPVRPGQEDVRARNPAFSWTATIRVRMSSGSGVQLWESGTG